MRVLMLSWEYPPHVIGGLGRHVADLTPELTAIGARVAVLTPLMRTASPREILAPGLTIQRVPVSGPDSQWLYDYVMHVNSHLVPAARALAGEVGGFDLIHAHDWLVAAAAMQLSSEWYVPLVTTMHATERGRNQGGINSALSERINAIEARLSETSARVIVCSQFMAAQVHDYFGAQYDKIDVVPNGVRVPPGSTTSDDDARSIRRRYADDAQRLALYVGRVVYEKGLQVLLPAWLQVTAQCDARLVIAGTGSYLDDLRRQAAGLGLHERVWFTGFLPDAERDALYRMADVAVFPSLYEPFGIVALEAMAACCPVVVSATGGLQEVVDMPRTGLLVPPGDGPALAQAVLAVLRDPATARARAIAAHDDILTRFSWQHVAQLTLRVYNRIYGAFVTHDPYAAD